MLRGTPLIAACFVVACSSLEAGLLYTVHERETGAILQSIDTDSPTLQVTDIGPLGVTFHSGALEYDPIADVLYGLGGGVDANDTSSATLLRINRTTGAATLIGSHGIPALLGLAFDTKNNVMYATQSLGATTLYRINTADATAAFVAGMSLGVEGLAYNPDSFRDKLAGIQYATKHLLEIGRDNGGQIIMRNGDGDLDGNDRPDNFDDHSGLAYDLDKNLYWHIDTLGNLYSYDPERSHERTLRKSGLGLHASLAYASAPPPVSTPVSSPEPASLTIAGIGAALMTVGALRRRGQDPRRETDAVRG